MKNIKFKKQDILHPYKECAGKDCPGQGCYCLRIQFIKKYGWFCDSCKNSLIDDKLANDVTGNGITEGSVNEFQ